MFLQAYVSALPHKCFYDGTSIRQEDLFLYNSSVDSNDVNNDSITEQQLAEVRRHFKSEIFNVCLQNQQGGPTTSSSMTYCKILVCCLLQMRPNDCLESVNRALNLYKLGQNQQSSSMQRFLFFCNAVLLNGMKDLAKSIQDIDEYKPTSSSSTNNMSLTNMSLLTNGIFSLIF